MSFIQDLENSHKLKFYFQEELLAGKSVTGSFNNTPIDDCLQKACNEAMLNFYRTGSKIYLFNGPAISENFLNSVSLINDSSEIIITDESLQELRTREYKITTIGVPGKSKSNSATLRGRVVSFDFKTPVSDGNVIVSGTNKGVSTNQKGFYEVIF